MIVKCPFCGKAHQATESMVGRQVRCTGCKRTFTGEPAPEAAAPSPHPAAKSGGPGPTGACCRGAGLGKLLLVGGLVMVVLARGGGGIIDRSADRAKAGLAEARSTFSEEWQDKFEGVDDAQERRRLEEGRDSARAELTTGKWRRLERAAAHAANRELIWRYWLQWVFVAGAIALMLGLCAVGFGGSGAERTVCLVMIAIITFSIFVAGSAWGTTIKTALGF